MSIIPKYKKLENQNLNISWSDQLAKNILFNKLSLLKHGFLQIHIGDMIYEFGDVVEQKELHAVIHVHDARVFKAVMFGGEPAAGKTYVQAWWSSENILDVIRIFTLNRAVLFSIKYGFASLAKYFYSISHKLNKNSQHGSRRNIQAHYDIGNSLYSLFLDKSMMYSSAYYTKENDTLEKASEYKLKMICEKLDLRANDQVLEIGSGWGGFAVYAAENYGCNVTTITISDEQYSHVKKRIESRNLSELVTVEKQDYRNLENSGAGKFDKLVSIEMVESVGHQYLDEYFKICSRMLKSNGMMLIQAITISDYLYKDYLGSMDFIRKHVFPGGSLPCVSGILNSISRGTDLSLFHSESFASSYARTLECWYDRFVQSREKVIELGYPHTFLRLWEYYLKYCQVGFEERIIDVHHLCFRKPDNRYVLLFK